MQFIALLGLLTAINIGVTTLAVNYYEDTHKDKEVVPTVEISDVCKKDDTACEEKAQQAKAPAVAPAEK
jgi:hypothetical protein